MKNYALKFATIFVIAVAVCFMFTVNSCGIKGNDSISTDTVDTVSIDTVNADTIVADTL